MYSYEERIRAVELYIKLGKRTASTILQLGYPAKNALKAWYREYEHAHDLHESYVRLLQKYSGAEKQVAVDHYLTHDRCLAGTLKALGYPCRESLTAWIDELHPKVRHRIIGKAAGVKHSPEHKKAAVIALCTREISSQAFAQQLTVSRPTLYNWKNQLLGREAPPSMKHNNDSPPDLERTELQQQVDSLRRDIRQLQLERDL